MSSDSEPLVVVTANGLYCPPGDFYIDPWQPVQNRRHHHMVTATIYATAARATFSHVPARVSRGQRLGGDRELAPVDYGARQSLGATTVSLHPAGHILGSAQVRIEHEGRVWVVSGRLQAPAGSDLRAVRAGGVRRLHQRSDLCPAGLSLAAIRAGRRGNSSLVALEPGAGDRLRPVLLCAWEKRSGCSSELRAFTDEPVYVHGAVDSLTGVYRRAGVGCCPR